MSTSRNYTKLPLPSVRAMLHITSTLFQYPSTSTFCFNTSVRSWNWVSWRLYQRCNRDFLLNAYIGLNYALLFYTSPKKKNNKYTYTPPELDVDTALYAVCVDLGDDLMLIQFSIPRDRWTEWNIHGIKNSRTSISVWDAHYSLLLTGKKDPHKGNKFALHLAAAEILLRNEIGGYTQF